MTAVRLIAPGRTTTTDQAYEAILTAVLDGSLEPGTHLPLQDLAQQLGTSMQPVREAIRRLEAIGIIDVEPHRGARVRALTDADFEDTYRTRLAIECLLVERAALQFTAEDEAKARAALDEQQYAAERGNRGAARAAHQEFHFAIYRAAQSEWLFRSMLPTWHNAERYRVQATVSPTQSTKRRTEHLRLLKACIAHDAEAARGAMREHLLQTVRQHSQHLAAEM